LVLIGSVVFRAVVFRAVVFRAVVFRAVVFSPVLLSPGVAGALEPAGASPAMAVPASSTAKLALPRHLTIELRRDGTWAVDGVRFASVPELEPAVLQLARSGMFTGVAVFGAARGENPAWRQLSDVLSRAALAPIRHAGRAAPIDLALLVRASPAAENLRLERPAAAASEADAASLVPRPDTAASAGARAVSLSTVGLHVAGPANREENRRKLVALFERRFDAFQRCYGLAHPHAENASFGVDLLIPAKGGKPTVRQTRTRLRGAEFKACMLRVFEALVFEPLPTSRSEIVSYSVLFKPGAERAPR